MDLSKVLSDLPSFPLTPSKTDIIKRKKMLDAISNQLEALKIRLTAEYSILYSTCDHSDSYSSNWCGRDPGGGGCNVCGKVW